MPEGDAIHRTAARLRVLEGDVLRADSPNPRAALLGIARRIDGRRLERVEAVGKNILLTFEGGTVVRSHLRMHGRWRVEPAGRPIAGKPWLVLRGTEWQAVQRRGPVLELGRGRTGRLGPDIMVSPPDLDGMLARFRAADQSRALGEALLDQTLAAGIGNMWKAEALYVARLKPWVLLRDVEDDRLRDVLGAAATLMQAPGRRAGHRVYRRAGRPCANCGTTIRSWPQGDDARMAYWCPRLPGRNGAARGVTRVACLPALDLAISFAPCGDSASVRFSTSGASSSPARTSLWLSRSMVARTARRSTSTAR